MLCPFVARRLEALQPAAFAELTLINELAFQASDPALLQLCSGYIQAALRCEDWREPEEGLSDRERAFIDVTEQFVTSVSTLSPESITNLLQYASADEVYAFVHAIYVIDMTLRLDTVGRAVLA
jgi:hypothetical protein